MLDKIIKAVESYDQNSIEVLVQQAKDSGIEARDILNDGLIGGMNVVGKRFSEGSAFVPEVLMAANTMKKGLEIIKDDLTSGDMGGKGTVVMGTVKGDLHDIGKKLVAMMLEGAGYKVVDLGVDVDCKKFIEAIKEHDADFVGMSAMLTTTMTEMEKVTEAIGAEGLKAIPLVGGAPVTNQYAEKINANYSSDASGAVELANGLLVIQ